MLTDCKTFHDLVETCKKIDLTNKDCFKDLFDKPITEQQKQNVIKFSIICKLCSEQSIADAFAFNSNLGDEEKAKKIINKLSSKKSLTLKNKKELSFKSNEIVDFINNNNLNNADLNKFSFDNDDEKTQQKQNIANNLSIILFGNNQQKVGQIGQSLIANHNYSMFNNLITNTIRDVNNTEERKLYELVKLYNLEKGKEGKDNKWIKDPHKEKIVQFMFNNEDKFEKKDLTDICGISKNNDPQSSLGKLIKNIDLSNDNSLDIKKLKADLIKHNILSLDKGISEQTRNLVFGFLCSNYNQLNDDNKEKINNYVKKQFLSINNIDGKEALIDEQDIESMIGDIASDYDKCESIEKFIEYTKRLFDTNIGMNKVSSSVSKLGNQHMDSVRNVIYDVLSKQHINTDDCSEKIETFMSNINDINDITISDMLERINQEILNEITFDPDNQQKNDNIKEKIQDKLKFKLKVFATKDKELYNQRTSIGVIYNFILSEEGNELLSDLAIKDTKKQLRANKKNWKKKTSDVVDSKNFKDALIYFFENFKNNNIIDIKYNEQDHKLSIGDKTFEFGEDRYGSILNEYLNNIIEQAKQEEEQEEQEQQEEQEEQEEHETKEENGEQEENEEKEEKEEQKNNIKINALYEIIAKENNYKTYIKPYILSQELAKNMNKLKEEKNIEKIKDLMIENVKIRYSLIKTLSRNVDTKDLQHPISDRKMRWYIQNAKQNAIDNISAIENASDQALSIISETLLNNDIKINGQQIITKKEIAENTEKPDEKQVYYEAIPLKEIKKERKKTFKLKTTTNRKEVRNDIINELKQLKNIHKAKQQENPEI